MEPTPLDLLGHLHDSTVLSINYDFRQKEGRNIILRAICRHDCGYESWNGKTVTVLLKDVILLNHFLCGFVTSAEEINSWAFEISPKMEMETQKLRNLGIDCSGRPFSISFHSGSHLEGICREIAITTENSHSKA